MAFQIDPIDQAKLDALKRIGFGNIQVAELVAVHWPAPTGTIYYAMMEYDRFPEYKDLTLSPIEARFDDKVFQKVNYGSSIDDSTVTFNFIDEDGEIARLCHLHGEGVRVQILFYFTQVGWLRERWWGHLGTPDEVGSMYTPVPASFGFRSSQAFIPHRTRGAGCPHQFGGGLSTVEEVAANPCRYDRQVGGAHGQLDPATDQPYTSCPKNLAACIARIGDGLEYGGGETAADTIIISETKGPNLQATSRGNETNLKQSRSAVFGFMKLQERECLASLVEPDTNHPDKGSAHVLIDVCEGPIKSMTGCYITNQFVGAQHLNVRLGTWRQARTSFSQNVNNYSMSAVFNGVIQGDFRGYQPGQFRGACTVEGLTDIRVYSDPNTYAAQYSIVPAWCILHMLTNKVWGDGQDYSRFEIQDWIDCAEWQSALAGFADANGDHYTSVRAAFNGEIMERTAQQQMYDACLYSGLSLPFPFQGKNRILPLKKEDLTNVPVFTDDVELADNDPNIRLIHFDDNGSTLRTKKAVPDRELTNLLLLTFFDAAHDNIQRPLTFEDEAAQKAAGKAAGDTSRRVNKSEKSGLGITDFGQAVRIGNRLLDLGEFDKGGIKNDREASFIAEFLDTLDLHKFKVIKIISKTLERYGFQYFRVQEMADEDELLVSLRTVAYPEDYYEQMEDTESVPERPGTSLNPNPGGARGERPFSISFGELVYNRDKIHFKLSV